MNQQRVLVAGVGMTPFTKPSAGANWLDIGQQAVRAALADAGVDYKDVQQAYAGYMFGETCMGQGVVYGVGMTGIPVFNVHNACATGSSAIYLARQAIASGAVDCALAFGLEQMVPGALAAKWDDRPLPAMKFFDALNAYQPVDLKIVPTAQLFGAAAREHMDKYGTKPETFGKITVKARAHAARNPHAVFRDPLTLEQVMRSEPVFDPLTRYQCCPPTTGAAAALLCSEAFARKRGLDGAVAIRAQALRTDFPSTFERSGMRLVGYDMAKAAAKEVYEAAGVGPDDVDVVELHDCFTANELVTYESLGLAAEGGAEKMIEDGDNTYGGKYVVNPSGGLLSKGHPIGATGVAQCAELVWQLRGQAGDRQVAGARLALQHNLGVGGACVVTLYEKM
jgi:acetyl-CoA acetyltransferase